MSSQTPADAPRTLTATLLTALLALVFGFLGAAVWSYSGLADNRTRTFLLANPDLLPQMAEAFEAQEAAKRLTEMGGEVFTPFPGVVLGNPQGTKVLVEFTDYNCPYCEASLKDVNRLIAEDPDLKVVIREWPIFEGSDAASRIMPAASMQLKPAHMAVAPVSAAMASMKRGVLDSSASAALSSRARRAPGPVSPQVLKASAAASTAITASAALAAGARVATLPSSGLRRSKVAPFSAVTFRPLMSMDRSDMGFS